MPPFRCELKRRKLGLPRGLITIDFKACTMTCNGEVIKIDESASN